MQRRCNVFRLVKGGERLPQRATRYSAGFDVFAREDVLIGAGETKLIGLGITLDEKGLNNFSDSYYLELHPRSSLRVKGLGGGVGIIDMDYRDELKMVITNLINRFGSFPMDRDDFIIQRGDKIGQLILKRHEGWMMPHEYTLDEERVGGFGSTGE